MSTPKPGSNRGSTSAVMWFRRDLRVRDNPALLAALEEGSATALFVVDPAIWATAGPARRAWLAANVLALADRIPLTIRHGDPREVVPQVADGRRVHIAAETTPYGRRRDAAVAEQVELVATGSPYAVGPGLVRNGSGGPYQVFSAFARAWREHGWSEPAHTPRSPELEPADSDQRSAGPAGGGGGRGAVRAARRRRGRRLAPLAVLPRRRPARLPRRAQPPRPRRHLAALALPPPRGAPPALAPRRGPPHVDVRHRAGVARASTPTCCGTRRPRRGRTSSPRWRG